MTDVAREILHNQKLNWNFKNISKQAKIKVYEPLDKPLKKLQKYVSLVTKY